MSMKLPPARPGQKYVEISAMAAGHLTLPEYVFFEPSDRQARKFVPSMSFLVQHPDATLFGGSNDEPARSKGPFRLLFDLGLRGDPQHYIPLLQKHIKSRHPVQHRPSVKDSLISQGISLSDIHAVVLSHVHWDHHGDPGDFPNSIFLLGHGSLDVLKDGLPGTGTHSHFDPELLRGLDAIELQAAPSATKQNGYTPVAETTNSGSSDCRWQPIGPFPAALDLFGDSSVYIINAPGHMPGHINLLCRTGERKWVYLGGDVAHDFRLLTGEKRIATYPDESGSGETCCVHINKDAAQESMERVGQLLRAAKDEAYDVEVIVAHDERWFHSNHHRLFPKIL